MWKKINNYFYQFEIEKEWKQPTDLLQIIYNKITNVDNRIWKDYDKSKIKVNIVSITKLSKKWEYRIVFQKW